MEILNIIIHSLSGLLLFFVGLMRLSNPIKTYSNNSGIELANDVNLLNEIRGLSAVQLLGGAFILSGIILPEMSHLSFAIAALIFVGFAIGRITSMVKDGKPNKKLTQGLIFEVVFGAANIFGLLNSMP